MSRFSSVKVLVRIFALACLVVGVLGASSAWAKNPECALSADTSATPGPKVEPTVELELANQSDQVLNFADGRGIKSDYVVLKASNPLPETVRPEQFEVDVLTPMKRIGSDTLESTQLEPLSYSQPRIFDHNERVSLHICANAANGKPGTYTGQVLISGPAGVASASVTQTAQLKSKKIPFLSLLLAVLVGAGVILWLKTGIDLKKKKPETRLRARILITVASLLACGGAMYLVYNSDPAWGADWAASAAALVGTALSAAGLGSSFSGAVQKYAEDAT